MILLTTITELFTIENICFLGGVIIPILILLFSAKYRGIWASIWFLPVLLFALRFAMTFEVVSSFIDWNYITYGLVQGFETLMVPFTVSVDFVLMSLLGMIAPNVDLWQVTILGAAWFPLVLYGILWLLFLAIFKKKRRRKKAKRYEDDF